MLTNNGIDVLNAARERNKELITAFKDRATHDLSVMVLVTSATQTMNAIDAMLDDIQKYSSPSKPEVPPYPELTDVVMPVERRQPVPVYPPQPTRPWPKPR